MSSSESVPPVSSVVPDVVVSTSFSLVSPVSVFTSDAVVSSTESVLFDSSVTPVAIMSVFSMYISKTHKY